MAGGAQTHQHPERDLIPREFLRVIGIWSLVPSYLIAGGFIGWLLDRWFSTFPYLTGLSILFALALSVRDMLRLRDEFIPPCPPDTDHADEP